MIESTLYSLLTMLALPTVGLPAVFVISFIAATLLPLGAEPAVFAVIKANHALLWPAIIVATAGNTLGGMFDYWLGLRAKHAFAEERQTRWFGWLQRFGAKTMLLGWMPIIGDPLCTLAGWLKLPFWPCVFYMAIGKFVRFVVASWLLLHVSDEFWLRAAHWLG